MSSADAYRGLVERLQAEAREAPDRYRFKVMLLAVMGFAVLGTALALALGMPVALIVYLVAKGAELGPDVAYFSVFPLAFAAVVLRALWIRIEAPSGYRLQPGDAPLLQAEVERLRAAVGAPALDGIVIDCELNAGAANVPRVLGLCGYRHYLVLGWPLLQLLDRPELVAVIAHEFGHFGEGHGRFAGWIHRLRHSWSRLLDGLSARNFWTARMFAAFFNWYVPYFNAYSFVLARGNEYQADAAAVRAAGAEVAASALIRLALATQRLERDFWPRVRSRSRAQPRPPVQVYRELADVLRGLTHADTSRLMAVAKPESDLADTHPALPQRVAAMGAIPVLRKREPDVAADMWLGDLQAALERRFSQEWREAVEPDWRAEYEGAAVDRDRLAEVEGRMSLTPAEAVELARLTDDLRPDFDAMALYLKALDRAPDHAMGHYRLGLLQFRRGDWAAGLERLRRAMELDPGAIAPALARLEADARDPGVDDAVAAEMRALRSDFIGQATLLQARDELTADDQFLPHDLEAAQLRVLHDVLARVDRIGRAWVARKRLGADHEPSHYAVLVTWRGTLVSEAKGLERVVDALELPGSFTVFTDSERTAMVQRVKQVCGDPVYRSRRW